MSVEATRYAFATAHARPAAVPLRVLPAAVGFFFGFRVFLSLIAIRVFGAELQTGTAVSLAVNFLLLAVVVFHSLGKAERTLAEMLRLPCSRWILLFLGFSGVSLLWSEAVSLPAAAAFWGAMVADYLMVLLLLRSGPAEAATAGVMKGYVAGACAIAICAWIMPAQTDLRLGDDELLGPNQIGFVCALAIFFAQYLMRSSGARLRLATAFLAITLLRSLSKTTIVAVVLGETVLLFRDKFISRKTKIWIVVAAVVVLAIFSGLLSSYFEIYSNAGNQAETLTGRLGIWGYFLEKAIEQPWIGHGFHSVWKVIPPFGKDQFEARHAHNEVLQQFYAYGVAGVVMLAGLYLSFYRNVRRMPASAVKTLLLGLLVFVLVRGLADTEAFDLTLPLWAIPMFTSAMVWRASN